MEPRRPSETYKVIVQASSTSWSGGRDLCMEDVDGYPAVYWTIKNIVDNLAGSTVTVAAPAFDRGGALDAIGSLFPGLEVGVYYGFDGSPLDRMLSVCSELGDDDHIIRIDGLHFCVDVSAITRMMKMARDSDLDCVKFPDDFPVQFTSDVYRVGAIRRLALLLRSQEDQIFRVHPKFYMFWHRDVFRCRYLEEAPSYPDEVLYGYRETARSIYRIPRLEVNEKRILSGDQLAFHYEYANRTIEQNAKVLDVACGDGYGTRLLAKNAMVAHGVDLDEEIIETAKQKTRESNVHFHVADVTKLDVFPSSEFDAVVSMETIEHVDPVEYLKELNRVLKDRGTFIISTPQNSMGHIPVNAEHIREYSLNELLNMVRPFFKINHVIGIKAGCVVVPGDPYGTNTMLVCQKVN